MGEKKKVAIKERLRKLGVFFYNREKHTVLGRTALSWALILLFYIVFYGVLIAFFVGMLCVLLYGVVDDMQPKLTGAQSLLRMVPSVDFKPRTVIDSTLIYYKVGDDKSTSPYVNNLLSFYSSYSSVNDSLSSPTMNYANCSMSDPQANKGFDPSKKICRMNPATDWGNCTLDNSFGFQTNQPCVIVKLNRMYGWVPTIVNTAMWNHTMLVCEGENDGDIPNLGTVEYYPGIRVNGTNYGYFSSALFPFLNQPGYTSAAIAVRFVGIRHNVLVMVQCRVWNVANNVIDKPNRIGVVHFELLVVTP